MKILDFARANHDFAVGLGSGISYILAKLSDNVKKNGAEIRSGKTRFLLKVGTGKIN